MGNNAGGPKASLLGNQNDSPRDERIQPPEPSTAKPSTQHSPPERCSVLPLSMRILRSMGGVGCCRGCPSDSAPDEAIEEVDLSAPWGPYCGVIEENPLSSGGISPMILGPMTLLTERAQLLQRQPILERILTDYRLLCQFYDCPSNAGVVTTLRYSLPSLKVSTGFGDADMLALADLLFRYGNGPLSYIQRLDCSPRLMRGTGVGSHGALALAKVVQHSRYISHVIVERNRIGAYGATALFLACATPDTVLTQLDLRRCAIGEKGGLAFASHVLTSAHCRLVNVDLSANQIGYHGSIAIERALVERETVHGLAPMILDLEGNLVFQEVMNSVTHGLGVILAFAGSHIMSQAARGQSPTHVWSCAVYSTSLVVLYTSSTLYHSFFTMRHTKWVFEVLDKCAIYILIAGSYTPFLQIVLSHEPLWSTGLLAFLWLLCAMGVGVEFIFPTWQTKGRFSLAMYLGMGWSALVCLPEVARSIDQNAINLMALGGVAYTAGVPFFVRDNNLDHAIWHMFVMAGSIFHWCGIYFYITPFPIAGVREMV